MGESSVARGAFLKGAEGMHMVIPSGSASARRRAFAIIYIGLSFFAMLAIVSLAVDMGRLRVARVQLATAADASALAGTQKIPLTNYTTATSDAVDVASENVAIQGMGNAVPVVLQSANDIEFGLYRSGGIFTVVGKKEPNGNTVDQNECNAIHVTANRTSARSSAVGLFFARAIGLNTMDVKCQAIAVARGAKSGFGLVGLDWVHLNGITKTDAYNAALGPYGGNNVDQHEGTVASNGSISLVGTVDV